MKFIYTIFLLLFFNILEAQTAPVDQFQQDDYYRVQQLMGSKDNRSFTIKPLTLDPVYEDSLHLSPFNRAVSFKRQNKICDTYFYGVDMVQEYNSKLPWGWNDGGMIPAKGYQTMISAGFFARLGPLTVSLKPELVYAANPSFPIFSVNQTPSVWNWYTAQIYARINAPERFGNNRYQKILPGQSSVKINIQKISIGVSSENMWWGPGLRNSIMLSNSASGFLHGSLNTNKPIKTSIGNFEFQLIGGILQNSGIQSPYLTNTNPASIIYVPHSNEKRYLSALILTWQPRWIKGLTLGFTEVVYEYDSIFKASKGVAKLFPIVHQLFNASKSNLDLYQDQIASVFFRYLLPKANAELYGEYARNDNAANLRDLLQDLSHSSGYTIGARKLFFLKQDSKKGNYIDAYAEMTNLAVGLSGLLRPVQSYYAHDLVTDGYTQLGKMVGAGIGPGGICKTIDISLVNNLTKVGIMLEQRTHNHDFYDLVFTPPFTQWIDYTIQFHGQKQFKKCFIYGEINWTKFNNYEWWRAIPAGQNIGYADFGNIHGKLAIRVPL